jgi:hypothetical protein
MKVRALLVAVGISGLLALSACEQQTTNPSSSPGSGYPGTGYPGAGPGGTGPGASSVNPDNNVRSGNSSNPMR